MANGAARAEHAEQGRIGALRSYGVLDAPREAEFHDIVAMAAKACGTSIALINLIDADRQWFLAEVGIGVRQMPLDHSIWAMGLHEADMLVVPDTTQDARLAGRPLAAGEPPIGCYAGVPLKTPEGLPIGVLCVADQSPHGFSEQQCFISRALARTVMAQLGTRRALRHQRESERRSRLILASAIDYAIISFDLEARVTSWNEGARRILRWTEAEMLGQLANEFFTPEDVAAGIPGAEMTAALTDGHGTDERWHVRKGGERFWANGEMMALRDEAGVVTGFIKILRDRTEQRLAAEKLLQSQYRLETALGTGLVGFFDWNIGRNKLTGDERFAEFYGISSASASRGVSIESVLSAIDPGDRDASAASLSKAASTAQPYSSQFRLMHADGSARWILMRGRPHETGGTAPRHYTGIVVDITAAKASEDALRMNELRQSALIELGDRLRETRDMASVIKRVTEMLRRVLDVTRASVGIVDVATGSVRVESASTPGSDISIEGLHAFEHFGAYFEDLLNGQTVTVNDVGTDPRTRAESLRALGIEAFINVPILEDGRLTAIALVHQDRTRVWTPDEVDFIRSVADRTWAAIRQARAIEALYRLNQTLEAQIAERTLERDRIWNVSHDMMGVADRDGVWLSINPAWTERLGWPEQDIIGRTSEWMEHPDDAGKTRAEVELLATGNKTLAFENRFRSRNGDHRWLAWTAVPEGDRLYCVMRDVTLEKERERELSEAHEALRQAQKMEAVGQLTGGVAHDFNNLLTIIRSSVDLLRRRDLPENRRRRYVDAISDTVDRAAKLTGQLLAFARRQPLKPEVFDVGRQVTSVSEMVRSLVGARISIDLQIREPACYVEADIGQFETALVNLAVNARDAMDGEGRLRFAVEVVSRVPPIRGHLGGPGDFITVSVTDSGTGIAADQIERIFEPFFTTKGVGKGTGLGLSQVFGFVKQSGGEIDVLSDLGRGATFTLYLPRVAYMAPDREETATSSDTVSAGHGAGASVLVVEDNQAVGAFSTQMLQDLGYTTTWAANADEALSLLAEDHLRFDVVFSDVVMPGMSGVELGQVIRVRYPALPVILTSGYSHVLAEEGRHGFELLQKPYSVEAMSHVLRRVIGKRFSLRKG